MQEVFIRSNLALRQTSLEVFDRTFAITHVLRMLALVVAFAGILSALMAIQLERAREMAVLRAVGVTPREVGWMMTLQSGLMGLAAGLLALPLGLVMAWVLTYVINLRSFGWTLQFVVSIDLLGQAVVVSTAAALLAGLYPAIIMSRAKPAEALRGE
jgi:putative ABC transport system permease protein